MALTYSIKKHISAGNSVQKLVDVTIGVSGDYSSGITVDATSCGLNHIDQIQPVSSDVGVLWAQDLTTGKLRGYKTAAATSAVFIEVAGADVATKTVRILAIDYGSTAWV